LQAQTQLLALYQLALLLLLLLVLLLIMAAKSPNTTVLQPLHNLPLTALIHLLHAYLMLLLLSTVLPIKTAFLILITAQLDKLNAMHPIINALLLLPAPILNKDYVLPKVLQLALLISAQQLLQLDVLIRLPTLNAHL
jgi:hypothetical protein